MISFAYCRDLFVDIGPRFRDSIFHNGGGGGHFNYNRYTLLIYGLINALTQLALSLS